MDHYFIEDRQLEKWVVINSVRPCRGTKIQGDKNRSGQKFPELELEMFRKKA